MNKRFIAAAIVALSACANASAQIYVGASVGGSSVDLDCAGATSCDKTDTAFSLRAGYQVTPLLGMEVNYFNLGKATISDTSVPVTGDLKGQGVDLVGTVRTQFNEQFGVFAKAGLSYVSGKTSLSSPVYGNGSDTTNSVQGVYGVGATYKITPALRVRVEADMHRVKIVAGEKGNVTAVTLGLEHSF